MKARHVYTFRGSVPTGPVEEEPAPTPKRTYEEPQFISGKDAVEPIVKLERSPLMVSITNDLNDIVRRACIPIISFIGMVAVKLRENDVRVMLQWNEDAKSIEDRLRVVQYADTMEEFVMKNRDLGPALLDLYITAVAQDSIDRAKKMQKTEEDRELVEKTKGYPVKAESNVNACFELDDLEGQLDRINSMSEARRQSFNRRQQLLDEITALAALPQTAARDLSITNKTAEMTTLTNAINAYNAMDTINLTEVERVFAPAWAFEMMPVAIFRKILSTTSLAAIEATCSAVNRIPNCAKFTIKELICSKQVNDQFAFLVAASYLSSGDRAPPPQGGPGRGRNNTYLNIITMRQQLADHIYTCNIFFELQVRKRSSELRSMFQKQITTKAATMDPALVGPWMERMMRYKAQLPAFELVVVQDYY